jgi:ABC-2 type transport system ATP-binding protein
MVGGERIELVVQERGRLDEASRILSAHALDEVRVDAQTGLVSAAVRGGPPTLAAVIDALSRASISVGEIGLRRATLDEVFLELTGAPADGA